MNINVLIQIVILFITIYNNTIAQKDYYNNKESIKNRNYIIDNNINVMKCYYYDASNKITLKDSLLYCVYEYDSLGNQIHAVLYSTTEKNHIEEEYYYKFDKKNNEIETNMVSDFEKYYSSNTYDSVENLIKRKWTDTKGCVLFYNIYKYDENYNIKSLFILSKDSVIKEKHLYKYNENNDIIEDNLYDSLDLLKETITYKYNKLFQKIEYKKRDHKTKQILKRITWKYENNKILKEIVQYQYYVIFYYNGNELSSKYFYDTRNSLFEIHKFFYTKNK